MDRCGVTNANSAKKVKDDHKGVLAVRATCICIYIFALDTHLLYLIKSSEVS